MKTSSPHPNPPPLGEGVKESLAKTTTPPLSEGRLGGGKQGSHFNSCLRWERVCQLGLPVVLTLATSLVMALPEDRTQPIQLEANRGQLDQKTGISIYEGNVIVQQGSMRMDADVAKIYVKEGQFQKMEATGKPVKLRYKPTVDKPEIHGTSPEVEYDVSRSKVVMSGGARLVQGGDVFTGDKIEYDLKSDVVQARGAGSNGRIKFTIQPQSENTPRKR